MKILVVGFWLCSVFGFALNAAVAAPFTPGNIVVYRVGGSAGGNTSCSVAGAAALSPNGAPVFIVEYTRAGVCVQSLPLPETGANALIGSGVATSEGLLTRSSDRRYLIITGYRVNAAGGRIENTSAAVVPRVVGRIDGDGNINTSTSLNDLAGANPRSAVSADGTSFWVTSEQGGIRYLPLGASSSTAIYPASTSGNFTQLRVFNNQLYYAARVFGGITVGTVGNGLPTIPEQAVTNLPGFPTTGEYYSIEFTDLSPSVPGLDTLYAATATGLQKFSLVGGNWVSNGTVGGSVVRHRGLAVLKTGANVEIWATRNVGNAAAGGGELVTVVDSSGYNGAFTGTPTVLATAPNQTAFRGMLISPLAPTAATVPIGGRVTNTFGGVYAAQVALTTPSGEVRTAITNPFGYYRFSDVQVGQTYIFSVAAKRFTFAPQAVFVNEERTDLNFTAQ